MLVYKYDKLNYKLDIGMENSGRYENGKFYVLKLCFSITGLL